MPRKAPKVTIGGAAPAAARDDERALERIGNRRAGESFDTEVPRYRGNGTRAEPRFRGRDQVDVRQTTVHLPRDLLRRVNVRCAETETTFSSLVERLLEAELATRRAG